ncbi:unnamed protein product [Cuscuta campestris]|uniref:Helicase ATP-binding domain-containing protein n=1 Tax=Cuscuta campestris TaxID=132261 RepID=A0A484NJY3_9ASTE|nr:unnamed protein product [Cuscuta campestris]
MDLQTSIVTHVENEQPHDFGGEEEDLVLYELQPSWHHEDNLLRKLQKRFVKIFLHASGNIAARFLFDQQLIDAFRKIPKAGWNAKERSVMGKGSGGDCRAKDGGGDGGMKMAATIVGMKAAAAMIESLDPLVRRGIAAANEVCDIRGKLVILVLSNMQWLAHIEMLVVKAIAVSCCIRESWPVPIITPSSLRLHWASVVLSQSSGSNRAGFKVVPSNAKRSIQLDGLFNIISYDIVPKLKDTLMASEFKVVIADESHFLKNAQAKRTNASLLAMQKAKYLILLSGTPALSRPIELFKQLEALFPDVYKNVHEYGNRYCKGVVIADESHFLKNAEAKRTNASLPVMQKAKYLILLSGSPALSRPIELFKQLEALFPDVYKNVHEYGNRYCKGGFFGVYQGASNHDEPHNLMKATVMIRRLKKDVLPQLLVKRRQQVFLNLEGKEMKSINALFRELELVKGKIKSSQSKDDYESLKLTEKNLTNKIYIASAEGKIPSVLDYLGTVVEKKKVGCIRIDGSTPAASRQALVTDFQEKESIKAAVMLDGEEKSLEVSAGHSNESPRKQKTLNSFMKRCSTPSLDDESMPKCPQR